MNTTQSSAAFQPAHSYFLVDKDTMKTRLAGFNTREEARSAKRTFHDSNLLKIARFAFVDFIR